MGTPKGMKCTATSLTSGDKVMVYNSANQIALQLRHLIATEEEIVTPSFKVAVSLTPAEAITIGSALVNAALPWLAEIKAGPQRLRNQSSKQEGGRDDIRPDEE